VTFQAMKGLSLVVFSLNSIQMSVGTIERGCLLL